MINTWSHDMVERWKRQVKTPYAELSEKEKESDRVEARKVLEAIGFFDLLEAAEGVANSEEIVLHDPHYALRVSLPISELNRLREAVAKAKGGA